MLMIVMMMMMMIVVVLLLWEKIWFSRQRIRSDVKSPSVVVEVISSGYNEQSAAEKHSDHGRFAEGDSTELLCGDDLNGGQLLKDADERVSLHCYI